jgi:hypothetical protein
LFDEKGSDLVDRRRPPGHQPGSDAMTGLQVELVWLFSWTTRRFGRTAASATASASL